MVLGVFAVATMTIQSFQSSQTSKTSQSPKTHKSFQNPEYLSLSHITKILNENYHLPLSRTTLAKYIYEGIITPDYVLKRKFLFHKDRVPEIVNTLKNKFREERLKKNSQNNIKKEDKNSEIDFRKMLLEVFKK